MASKSFYNTILSQTYSPCGNYLIVGDIYGIVSVFNLQRIMFPDIGKQDRKPKNTFQVECNIPINTLLTTENFLLVGTVGEIAAYHWTYLKSSKDMKPVWRIQIPSTADNFEKVDINCMLYNKSNDILFAGCGDNSIYAIDIDAGKVLYSLKGHTNYIHSIAQVRGNELVSGGEDGAVLLWDIRAKQEVHKLEPYKNSKMHRPELGKWIGAVDLNEDWLLCGGGPRLSLWHYRSLNASTIFPLDDKGIHIAQFYKDKILAGGRSKFFYQLNLNGDVASEIPTSSVSTYSAVYQDTPYTALCLAGSSPNIDICSNLNYCDQVLSMCTVN